MNIHGRQIVFNIHRTGAFSFSPPYLTLFYLLCPFFGPQVTIIIIYVVKLMHQSLSSMFRHVRCFDAVNVQVWVMFEVPHEM